MLVGWREPALAPAILGNRQGAVLGICDDGSGEVLCYDALADDELVDGAARRRERGAERAHGGCGSSSRS